MRLSYGEHQLVPAESYIDGESVDRSAENDLNQTPRASVMRQLCRSQPFGCRPNALTVFAMTPESPAHNHPTGGNMFWSMTAYFVGVAVLAAVYAIEAPLLIAVIGAIGMAGLLTALAWCIPTK